MDGQHHGRSPDERAEHVRDAEGRQPQQLSGAGLGANLEQGGQTVDRRRLRDDPGDRWSSAATART